MNSNLTIEIKRIFRFLIVGFSAALVDLLSAYILVFFLGNENYKEIINFVIVSNSFITFLEGKFEEVVSIISFCLGFVFSYYGHSKYTFRTGTSKQSFFKLLLLAFVNLTIRTLIIMFEKKCGIDGYVSIVISLVVVTVFSYIISKYWVFKK